ncbi:MAG: 50S ribosomal protein L6 [Oscillospiraceae bacterium]|jgi:large subunit ribosomal protein L6|nr:50S ribosomal protein L6 [Oscillospiraceae bacterium]
MSRIGKTPIDIPTGVTVTVGAGNLITVKGPKGELSRAVRPEVTVSIDGAVVNVTRSSDLPYHRAMHGLSRSLIANMVIGVTDGFKKELEINGVGYRAAKDGRKLVMNLGYSHQVIVEESDGITIDVPAPNKIIIGGIDKQAVGQFAADIRKKRPPEPYLGKGIKYADEVIRRKEGKTSTK